eukprot:30991-Pelagococcus_subviridis.AAC.4
MHVETERWNAPEVPEELHPPRRRRRDAVDEDNLPAPRAVRPHLGLLKTVQLGRFLFLFVLAAVTAAAPAGKEAGRELRERGRFRFRLVRRFRRAAAAAAARLFAHTAAAAAVADRLGARRAPLSRPLPLPLPLLRALRLLLLRRAQLRGGPHAPGVNGGVKASVGGVKASVGETSRRSNDRRASKGKAQGGCA